MGTSEYEPFGVPSRWLYPRLETSDTTAGLGETVVEGGDALDYLAEPSVFEYESGSVGLPDGPGQGVEMDESVARGAADDVNWHNPVRRHEGGSVAEW